MNCVVHPSIPATTTCSRCGVELCAECGAGGDHGCAPGRGRRRPTLAAFLALVPGLGQLYGGDPIRAVLMASTVVVLFCASFAEPRLAGFVAAVWIYQIADAHRLARPDETSPATAIGPGAAWWWTFGLIGVGAAFLVETLTGALLGRLSLLLPLVLIAAGARLLYTFFRPREEHG